MAVKGGEVAVNWRAEYLSLSARWRELAGRVPINFRPKIPTQIGSFSKTSKNYLMDRGTFSMFFDRSEHPPSYAVF